MSARKANYSTLSAELENMLVTLQQDDLDVDTAMAAYAQGLKLVHELESYLAEAENKVTKLRVQTESE